MTHSLISSPLPRGDATAEGLLQLSVYWLDDSPAYNWKPKSHPFSDYPVRMSEVNSFAHPFCPLKCLNKNPEKWCTLQTNRQVGFLDARSYFPCSSAQVQPHSFHPVVPYNIARNSLMSRKTRPTFTFSFLILYLSPIISGSYKVDFYKSNVSYNCLSRCYWQF